MKVFLTSLFTILLSVGAMSYAKSPSVFLVRDINHTYSATAFELKTPKGTVTITNKHVCGKESALFAYPEGSLPRIILVKKVYTKHDLCVLTGIYGVPALSLAKEYGDSTVTVEGYPQGEYGISQGPLIGYARGPTGILVVYKGYVTFGSSGSPVTDDKGGVTGVISMVTQSGTYGLMVPLEYLKDFLNIN